MKYIFLCLALIAGFSASAQFSVGGKHNTFDETHIKWDFTVSQVENKYTIEATAALENGWHIFSANPGGDGSLTPTQIEVNEIASLKIPVEFKESGSLVEKNLEGIGEVKYYEHKATFKITFVVSADIKSFTGNIAYQICNDVMCMAPTTKSFSVNVK